MRFLTATMFAAALGVAIPAQAHDGHNGWRHHSPRYAHDHRHFAGWRHDARVHHRHVIRREVRTYYYRAPVVAPLRGPVFPPLPGVHVVFPSIFLPFP
jgi:hypothetical protein